MRMPNQPRRNCPGSPAPNWPESPAPRRRFFWRFRGANRTGVVPEAAYRGWDGSQPARTLAERSRRAGVVVFLRHRRLRLHPGTARESESVVCYRTDTGKEVWSHGQPGKHADGQSGPGPLRDTKLRERPAVRDRRERGGVVPPARQRRTGLDRQPGRAPCATKPNFGLATSPLVVGDLVIIHPASSSAPRLAALDAATGKTRWTTEAKSADGYSSPHPATIAGVEQVLIFNKDGLFGYDPQTGGESWRDDWVVKVIEPTAVQPLVLPDGRVIVGGGNIGVGMRCVKVQLEGEKTGGRPEAAGGSTGKVDHVGGVENHAIHAEVQRRGSRRRASVRTG